jgi:hypothetical protein
VCKMLALQFGSALRLPLLRLFPNWLVQLADKGLNHNHLRLQLHRWLSWGAGARDVQFLHYVLMQLHRKTPGLLMFQNMDQQRQKVQKKAFNSSC